MRRHAVIVMNLCVVLAFAGPISIARAQDGVVVAWGISFEANLRFANRIQAMSRSLRVPDTAWR